MWRTLLGALLYWATVPLGRAVYCAQYVLRTTAFRRRQVVTIVYQVHITGEAHTSLARLLESAMA